MPTLQLKPSPIELLSQDVLSVELKATTLKTEFGESNLSVERKVRKIKDKPGCWGIHMEVRIEGTDPDNPPAYTGKIELIGYYNVHEQYKLDPERLIRITGASMLYGVAREMLSQITARSVNGLLTLPSVSFFEDVPEKKVSKKAAKKAAKKAPA